MRMPCGHLFHTSTLMMHLLTNDMRCPVCRRGARVRASLACVPANASAAFASKLEEMDGRDQELHVQEVGLYTSREVLEQGLRMVVEVHTASDVTVMSSRLVCELESADQVQAVFQAQQSFYRRLEQHLNALASLRMSVMLVFRVSHKIGRAHV